MRFFSVSLKERKDDFVASGDDVFPYCTERAHDEHLWLIPEPPSYEKNYLPSTFSKLKAKPLPLLLSSKNNCFFPNNPNPQFHPDETIQKKLFRRRLLFDELNTDFFTLQKHMSHGYVRLEPGIIPIGTGFQCQRCGNKDRSLFATFTCFRCKGECVYCRSCIMMGKVTSCSPLFVWNDQMAQENSHALNVKTHRHKMAWDGTLSLFQQKASDKLCETISSFFRSEKATNISDKFLIWAVCGSGKTEMLFHGMELALQMGLRVLVATPRTDVVLELEPRLKEAFPKTEIHAFYGGAKDRFAKGDLVISTTHQLLRFHKAFDLVIIDEVDAFPYTADRKLHWAVSKARKDRALTVFVTATPEEKMKQDAEKGNIICAKVARRYHQHPLPVPRNQWIGQWKKQLMKGRLPKVLMTWLQKHLANKKQIFLFVPSVKVMGDVVVALKNSLQETVDGVHSADEDRREKVLRFREGDTRVLVTTTILERGVTVKGVQVGVLGAEDRIFTESALVQIAGRAGRKPDEPTGDVVYFHYGKTKEMVKAIRHIQEMNKLGEKELQEEALAKGNMKKGAKSKSHQKVKRVAK